MTRRRFLGAAASAAAAWPLVVRAQGDDSRLFQHGVASGDPLTDRVILWTRVSPPPTRSAIGPIEVRWVVATDERLRRVIRRGTVPAAPERDFTVKVDAPGLQPGRTYYYAFDAGGQQSPIGRTKTLPSRGADRLRLAAVSCSNYPAGYFNVYRCLANRAELDLVVHLGDYIYEFANGIYGDGSKSGRMPLPAGEAITLDDYRRRYATYRTDVDLQEAHRRHPFVAVWDDHELANDAWSGGAGNHDASEGEWATRLNAGWRAYLEWMPVREAPQEGIRLYREFRFGEIADLAMLDTRALRNAQVDASDAAALADAKRSMLGAAQEAWLFDRLRASQRAGTRWRLIGQQILFSRITPPGEPIRNTDVWEGYPAARGRVADFLLREKIDNLAILTGDLHSSWALDVQADPWAPAGSTGAQALGVELVTPAISSPPLFTDRATRERAPLLRAAGPHIKYLEGDSRGYVLLDVTRSRLHADWYFVETVAEPSTRQSKAVSFVCEAGAGRLERA